MVYEPAARPKTFDLTSDDERDGDDRSPIPGLHTRKVDVSEFYRNAVTAPGFRTVLDDQETRH